MAFHGHKGSKRSPFRKEKERISRRFQMNLEAIIAKYDHPFDDSDVLNLNDMIITEDKGFLSSVNKQLKIGTIKLAVDKASSHSRSGIQWTHTKDSTDSAFGSTRYSESEDTSETETIANYSYQNTRFVGAEEGDKAGSRLEDIWMRNGSQSEDSGNEDVDSDHSGPICTPSKSLLRSSPHRWGNQDTVSGSVTRSSRPRARGNLSRRFDAEDAVALKDNASKRGMPIRVQSIEDDDEEEEEEDVDLYEFREELPSILEEKNRFLCKMQSILVDSFIDGDEIDDMDSQTDDEVSTGTMESSETTSGSISAWSTLPSKTTPKRTSEPLSKCQQDVDKVRDEIPTPDFPKEAHTQKLTERDAISSTDSDFTECSSILAGNLQNDRIVFHPSKLLRGTNQNRDFISNGPSQTPFQVICNSTMLSEINPSEIGTLDRKSPLDLEQHRGLELPLDGQGEMYLGEVPHFDPSEFKHETFAGHANGTPKADRNCEYSTPTRLRPPKTTQDAKRGDENSLDEDQGNCPMSPGGHDTSGITPRARFKKGASLRQTPNSLSSPRFNTNEIIEIFRSPKPLIIPGMDLEGLELTPRRKVKQEVTVTVAFKNALLRLQSPVSQRKADRNCTLGSQMAKEIRLQSKSSAHETALECETRGPVAVRVKESSDVDLGSVNLEDEPCQVGRRVGVKETADESFEDVIVISPQVCRDMMNSAHLKEDGGKQIPPQPVKHESKIPQKSVQRIKTLSLTHAIHAVGNQEASTRTKTEERLPNSRTCHNHHRNTDPEIRPTKACPKSLQSTALQDYNTKKHTETVTLTKTKGDSRSTKLSVDIDSDKLINPKSRKSSSQTRQATVEKPAQQSRPSRYTLNKDDSQGTKQEKYATPFSSKTPSRTQRAKKCPLTLTVQRSPSKLSSPLNRMSLTSPPNVYGLKKDVVSKDTESNRSTMLDARKKERVLSAKQAKSKLTEENLKLKSRNCCLGDKARLDRTHMTIRHSDDTSEEEMEVDPYSLTADDSSSGPRLYRKKPKLHPTSKSNTKCSSQRDRLHGNVVRSRDSEKLRYSHTETEHQSMHPIQEHSKGLKRDSKKSLPKDKRDSELSKSNMKGQLSGSLRQAHSLRNSENLLGFRQSVAARNTQSPSRRKEHCSVGSIQRSPQNSPPPSPIHGAFTTQTKLERQKSSKSASELLTRREHSQYFSDEECNSSGDSAKFVSSIPKQSEHKLDSDANWLPSTNMSPQLGRHAEQAVGSKLKTIKCGKIISTPKSAKDISTASSDLHKTRSPSRKGRVEKTRKMLSNSPTRTYGRVESQSESNSMRTSSKVVSGRQLIKTAARKLIASPTSRHGDVICRESSRPAMSSPLRASSCNVSSSYTCEGPGHCTKPFCFNCAFSELC